MERTESRQEYITRYKGRIDFGTGKIEPEASFGQADFERQLEDIAQHLIEVDDFRKVYGSCSDGRDNLVDDYGRPFPPRPKVLGGPNVFSYNVATIGQFSLVNPDHTPAQNFEAVTRRLMEKGFKPGMHYYCGAARNVLPVDATFLRNIDNILPLMGDRAQELASEDGGRFLEVVEQGLHTAINSLTNGTLEPGQDDFGEEQMMDIVRKVVGPDEARRAFIKLVVDHQHPNEGHKERGLVFLRIPNHIMDKPKAIEHGIDVFYQNAAYAESLVGALAQTPEELARGLIAADMLPIAGVATLGNRQYVGEILPKAA